MKENSKTVDEIISLYTLEKELPDLYVEGINDKLIIDLYTSYKSIQLKAVEIETVDFLETSFPDLNMKSNKDKLIALSRLLSEENIGKHVLCLIDKDFDGVLTPIEQNSNLLRTDYGCMESYFCCEKPVQKFIDLGIRNFPFQTNVILKEIGNVLRGLFIVGIIKIKFNLNFSLLKIDNNIAVQKNNGKIIFNLNDYINKFIIANKLIKIKDEILEFAGDIETKLDKDFRNTMNGHSFIYIFYLYVNIIKNTPNFKELNFERAFLLSIQPDHLDEYRLFKHILYFYH